MEGQVFEKWPYRLLILTRYRERLIFSSILLLLWRPSLPCFWLSLKSSSWIVDSPNSFSFLPSESSLLPQLPQKLSNSFNNDHHIVTFWNCLLYFGVVYSLGSVIFVCCPPFFYNRRSPFYCNSLNIFPLRLPSWSLTTNFTDHSQIYNSLP